MKLYDFDSIFDKKLAKFIQDNMGKYSEKEWDAIIPSMYAKFGDEYLDEIKSSPNEYFSKMSNGELVNTLIGYLEQKVPVCDLLCAELEKRNAESELVPLLDNANEDVVHYAVSLLGGNKAVFDKYFELMVKPDIEEDLLNSIIECLCEEADYVKERALELYKTTDNAKLRGELLDVLSRVTDKDDRIFEVLIKEFSAHLDDMQLYCAYLAAFGDERALPYLMAEIEQEGIDYLDFKELKNAIEACGGEYEKHRDFSSDSIYKKLARAQQEALNKDKKD